MPFLGGYVCGVLTFLLLPRDECRPQSLLMPGRMCLCLSCLLALQLADASVHAAMVSLFLCAPLTFCLAFPLWSLAVMLPLC